MRHRDEEDVSLCSRNSESGEGDGKARSGRWGRGYQLVSSGGQQPKSECGSNHSFMFKVTVSVHLNAISHDF